jgi:hypothetical protein
MLNLDYYFTYKNSIRLVTLLKFNPIKLSNIHSIPTLSKLIFFFAISKSQDQDSVSNYNCLYLFKFFFGKNAFLSSYKSHFSLGLWYYSFKVSIIINKKQIYNILFYYLNDYIIILDKVYYKYGVFSSRLNILYIVLNDLTIFSEKKTNMGLFNLQDSLNLHMYFSGGDINTSKLLLQNLKMNFFL